MSNTRFGVIFSCNRPEKIKIANYFTGFILRANREGTDPSELPVRFIFSFFSSQFSKKSINEVASKNHRYKTVVTTKTVSNILVLV